MERRAGITRHVGVNPINRRRRAALHERNFPPRSPDAECPVAREARRRWGIVPEDWKPCCEKLDQAHVRARGMGGVKGDKDDVVDLCRTHHCEQERDPRKFEAKYGLDLRAEADAAACARRQGAGK